MKSLIVFARIIIVGCLWSIVFIEGIRVIMLCNWHFDIFWPDHWRQAYALWKAGWVIRAPKEWAFVIILVTFFPMLITGWWTLCMVAWERIIYDIIMSPVTLYRRLIKTPINVMKTNNKYGVVKKKSYKQVRPAGVGFRMPISDYSDGKTAAPVTAGVSGSAVLPSQVRTPAPVPMAAAASKTTKKTDIPSAIDHALFKFDDDDDDFDLDIDSFEKADILKKKEPAKSKPVFDDDDEDEIPAKPRKNNKRDSNDSYSKRQNKKPVFDDDDDEDDDSDYQPRGNRNGKNNDNKDNKQKNNKQNSRDDSRNDKQSRSNNKQNNENTAENNDSSNQQRSPIYDILQQKGYDVIAGVNVNNTVIDFVGVSDTEICLCLADKESGDWLADEELFNGEEPLWFSENSHRISPVRKLDVARNIIRDKLAEEDFEQEVKSYVVIQMANIINADDMFEIWNKMDIDVTRVNRGAPKEIRLFSKTLDDAEAQIDRKELNRLRKVLKSIK